MKVFEDTSEFVFDCFSTRRWFLETETNLVQCLTVRGADELRSASSVGEYKASAEGNSRLQMLGHAAHVLQTFTMTSSTPIPVVGNIIEQVEFSSYC